MSTATPRTRKPTRKERAHARSLHQHILSAEDARPVMMAGNYSVQTVERYLDSIASRAKHVNPMGKGEAICKWVEDSKNAIHTDDWLKSKGEIALAASKGDAEAQEMHAAAVEITTTNVVTSQTAWLSFFEQRSLGPEEWPVMVAENPSMAITIDVIGQDGGNVTIQAQANAKVPTFCPIHMKATPWIEYPLVDEYKGSVKEIALAQFDVARDRAWRTDALLGGYLIYGGANTRLVDTFTTTGDPALRDYYAHPRVNPANLPAGNFVTLPGNTNTSLFRKEVFDAAIKYARAWGGDVLDGGALNVVEIMVPSAPVTDFLAQVTLTTQGNKLVDQIFDGGFVMSYAGYTWIVTGNNTLDPNQGVAYVRMNRPVGIFFDKPNLEKALTDESPEMQRLNKGRTCEIWAESFAMPLHWRKHVFGVRYRTPV